VRSWLFACRDLRDVQQSQDTSPTFRAEELGDLWPARPASTPLSAMPDRDEALTERPTPHG